MGHICGADDGCDCQTCEKAWRDWAMESFSYTTLDVPAESQGPEPDDTGPDVKFKAQKAVKEFYAQEESLEPEQREGLDFEKLREAVRVWNERATFGMTFEERHAADVVMEEASRLIDMAERCEVAERAAERAKQAFNNLQIAVRCEREEWKEERERIKSHANNKVCAWKYNAVQLGDRLTAVETEHQAIIDKLADVRRSVFPNKPCDMKGGLLEMRDEIVALRAECDRLQAELAALRSGNAGLTEEESITLGDYRRGLESGVMKSATPNVVRQLLDIIARLSARQPTLPKEANS